MTAYQQMRDILEKAGEKWHRRISTGEARFVCSCGIGAVHNDHADEHANPSPTDLNEIFRLIRKIGYDYSVNTLGGNVDVMIFNKNNEVIGDADADMEHLADAIRNALWQAIQEVEK